MLILSSDSDIRQADMWYFHSTTETSLDWMKQTFPSWLDVEPRTWLAVPGACITTGTRDSVCICRLDNKFSLFGNSNNITNTLYVNRWQLVTQWQSKETGNSKYQKTDWTQYYYTIFSISNPQQHWNKPVENEVAVSILIVCESAQHV